MRPLVTSWFCPNDCDRRPSTDDYQLLLKKLGPRSNLSTFHCPGEVTWVGLAHGGGIHYTGRPEGFELRNVYGLDWMLRINPDMSVTVVKNRFGDHTVRDIPDRSEEP